MRTLSVSLVLALGVAACSSATYEGPPAEDAGDGGAQSEDGGAQAGDGDATSTVDGSGFVDGDLDAPRATACTAPPFVAFTAHVREIALGGSDAALAGATVQFTSCAGFIVTADASGVASTQVTQGIAFSPLYYAPAHVSALGAEMPAASDATVNVALVQTTASEIIPEYATTKPSLEVLLVATGTAPCDTVDGVSLAVTGHPEGTARYMSAAWPSDKNPTNATSSVGPAVFFTGLAATPRVQIMGTKAGCKVTTVTSTQTGNFQLVNADVTIGEAVITN